MRCPLYKYPYITGTHGSATNPFVISTTEQWKEFVSYCNSNDTSSTVVILTADLDFSGESVSPAGNSSKPFKGKLYAQGHSIKNAKYETFNGLDSMLSTGLFGYLSGADIRDLAIDSSCSTVSISSSGSLCVGTVAAVAADTTFINVASNMSMTASGKSTNITTGSTNMGGFIGRGWGTLNFVNCAYRGTLNLTDTGSADNSSHNAGVVGAISADYNMTMTGCYFDFVANSYGGGINMGGILTNQWVGAKASNKLSMTGCIVKMQLNAPNGGSSPDRFGIVCFSNTTQTLKDCYVVANTIPIYSGSGSITFQGKNQFAGLTTDGNSSGPLPSGSGVTSLTYDTTPGGANERR